MSLDQSERVIMIGGFCSSLGPWLTLGYMVVPHRLIGAALAARRQIDNSPRWLEETALAEFLVSGGYARHVHRLGKAYASRRDALMTALRRHFRRCHADLGRRRRPAPGVVSADRIWLTGCTRRPRPPGWSRGSGARGRSQA
jgi:DNA-binding transcriptional MocR family regulator